jgi:hypothetical protein
MESTSFPRTTRFLPRKIHSYRDREKHAMETAANRGPELERAETIAMPSPEWHPCGAIDNFKSLF